MSRNSVLGERYHGGANGERALPVTWELQGSVAVLVASGEYGLEDLRAATQAVAAHPDFKRGTTLLLDLRDSEAKLLPADVPFRVEWLAALPASGFSSRMAAVAAGRDFRYGVARQVSIALESRGVDFRIFPDKDTAVGWLVAV